MLARGHRLDVGLQGLVGTAAYQNRSHVVMDVEKDKNYYKNPDLPLTRSEAVIPLAAHENILGVLDIQSTEPSAFSQDDIDLLQTMADQIAWRFKMHAYCRKPGCSPTAGKHYFRNIRRVWRERVRGGNKHSYAIHPWGLQQ